MKPTLDERTYYLKQFRKGWRARVRDSKATGWGITPELAIYDWRKQHAALVINKGYWTKCDCEHLAQDHLLTKNGVCTIKGCPCMKYTGEFLIAN